MGDIALSYTEHRTKHRRELRLRVHHELHNMERDNCDNFFYEIINVMKVRPKESHTNNKKKHFGNFVWRHVIAI